MLLGNNLTALSNTSVFVCLIFWPSSTRYGSSISYLKKETISSELRNLPPILSWTSFFKCSVSKYALISVLVVSIGTGSGICSFWTGSVTNLASATGSFNNQPIFSPQNIVTVRYKQPTNDIAHNGGFDNGGYGGAVVPIPMMHSSPMSNLCIAVRCMAVNPMDMAVNFIAQPKHKIQNHMATKLKLI